MTLTLRSKIKDRLNQIKLNSQDCSMLETNKEKILELLSRLTGNQLKILEVIVSICCDRDATSTGFIYSKDFTNMIQCGRDSRETAIKALCRKGLLKRGEGKRGLSSGFVFYITNEMLQIFLEEGKCWIRQAEDSIVSGSLSVEESEKFLRTFDEIESITEEELSIILKQASDEILRLANSIKKLENYSSAIKRAIRNNVLNEIEECVNKAKSVVKDNLTT